MSTVTNRLRDAASSDLAAVTHLTWQQKQLIRSGEHRQVLEQVLRSRRPLTWGLTGTAALSGWLAASSLLMKMPNWFYIVSAVLSVRWLVRRLMAQRRVAVSVQAYEASRPVILPPEASPIDRVSYQLSEDLRRNHHLTWDQRQRLKSGALTSVAAEVIYGRSSRESNLTEEFHLLGAGFGIVHGCTSYFGIGSEVLSLPVLLFMFASAYLLECHSEYRERRITTRLGQKLAELKRESNVARIIGITSGTEPETHRQKTM